MKLHVHKLGIMGQSLLEIVIMIGVVGLVMGGLTVTILVGLKNSQYSEDIIQATKFGQEGLEKVKYLRDSNTPICSQISGTDQPYFWRPQGAQNGIWTSDLKYVLAGSSIPYYFGNDTSGGAACQLTTNFSKASAGELTLSTKFTRKIYIEDFVSGDHSQKKITSEIDWSDSTGKRYTQIVTVLTSY